MTETSGVSHSADSPGTPLPLTVERISMQSDRMTLLVSVGAGFSRMTDAALARHLLEARPSLAYHTCINDAGSVFGDIIECTTLPHVLEHVIIDEQARDEHSDADRTFVGTTQWLDEAAGRARIEVDFADDLVVLRALDSALAFVNNMVLTYNAA